MNPGTLPGPRRLLVRGVNWLGDAVMTTPALQRLRERHPQTALWLLTDQRLADLWRSHPCIDGVLTFARGESPLRIGRRLRTQGFDTALVLPNSARSALEVWAAGIPRRIGYGGRWRSWFLNELVPPSPGHRKMRKRSAREIKALVAAERPAPQAAGAEACLTPGAHHIYQYLQLASALGAPNAPVSPALRVDPAELAAARTKWLGAAGSVWLGINPSAAYGEAKRWPVENFAAMAKEVSARLPGAQWVALGAAEDHALCERLKTVAGVEMLNLAGLTTLRELMALLNLCRVLVTNDTGPMHVAAALGTPVVALFGSTSVELTGPGLPGASVGALLTSYPACAPCFRRDCPIDFRCMKGITIPRVTAAVLELVQARAPSTA